MLWNVYRNGDRAILVRERDLSRPCDWSRLDGYELAFQVVARGKRQARDMAIALADPPLRALGTAEVSLPGAGR